MTPNEKHHKILREAVKYYDLDLATKEYYNNNMKIGALPIRYDEALTAMQTLQEECDEQLSNKAYTITKLIEGNDMLSATIASLRARVDELEKENLKLWNQLTIGGH